MVPSGNVRSLRTAPGVAAAAAAAAVAAAAAAASVAAESTEPHTDCKVQVVFSDPG